MTRKYSSIREAFLHIACLYEWIDYWYSPEKLWPGGAAFAGVHLRYPKKGADEEAVRAGK